MSAFNTKKVDFLLKLADMQSPRVYSRNCSVWLCGSNTLPVEIYRASTMEEAGYISADNQCAKFRRWINAA